MLAVVCYSSQNSPNVVWPHLISELSALWGDAVCCGCDESQHAQFRWNEHSISTGLPLYRQLKFPDFSRHDDQLLLSNHTDRQTDTDTRLNGLFSRTTWVSRHQKGKLFWILLKQEMMGWQWHQMHHMQIICTTLQTDNHASIPSLNFFTGRMLFLTPNQQ